MKKTAATMRNSWGFGHRVYKNYDPRAKKSSKKACHDVLWRELGIKDDPLLDLAIELEKIALNDKATFLVDRKLYPATSIFIPASS